MSHSEVTQYMGLRGPALSILIGVVAGLAFFLFGYDQGDFASILTVGAFRSQFPQLDTIGKPLSETVAAVQGITVGIWNLGCFVSAILTIFLGDRLGRKKTIFIGLLFLLIGEIIQCSSFSYAQLMVGRAIAGFGNGFTTATVPAWQAECTKAHRRGTLLMITAGAFIAAGLSFSYWMGFAFGWLDPNSAAWRAPIAIQVIFILLTMSLMIWLPESPRWLILTGREEEAINVLSALNDIPKDSEQVHQEFLQIKDAVLEMSKGGFNTVFQMGDYRHVHRTVLAVTLQIFQQSTGVNLVTQFLALMLLQLYGFNGWQARLIAAGAGTEYFLASIVPVIGIDRFWGRRSLMMFGASGMSISMVILTIMLKLDTTAAHGVGTAFLFVYCTFFAIGWQGMAWLYQVEVVPLRIRGPANAISTASNWVVNYAIVQIAPVAFHNIGYKTYIIFALTNAFIVPIIYFFYPETGFRSLEEIDVIFHTASTQPKPYLNVVRIAANEPLWYGKGGDEQFVYSESEWHKKHVRFSDEIKTSDGGTTTLRDSPEEGGSSDDGTRIGTFDNSEKERDYRGSSRGSDTLGQHGQRPSAMTRVSSNGVSPLRPNSSRTLDGNSNTIPGFEGGMGEEAAPSPVISRTSVDKYAARGVRSAGSGY
nr:hypothetical protein B0A51_14846 [Rachicladosporium sp. CCFEE 5018]